MLFAMVMGLYADVKSEILGSKTIIAPIGAFYIIFLVEKVMQ